MCNTFIMISCHYSGYEVKDGQKARAREREREREKRKDDGTRTRRGRGGGEGREEAKRNDDLAAAG